MITHSIRREYLGLHLTKRDREQLLAEAKRLRMSMSALASQFIVAGLQGLQPPPLNAVDMELSLEAISINLNRLLQEAVEEPCDSEKAL